MRDAFSKAIIEDICCGSGQIVTESFCEFVYPGASSIEALPFGEDSTSSLYDYSDQTNVTPTEKDSWWKFTRWICCW